ncbi:MAG: glycosyltransferase family 9 protein [Acidobacteriota bacterium]|nr:MAG: glycosyltransferase family 9 protein [Acidobacteriota bacterium]
MRILFIKLSSIGDIVHTLPALAAVRRRMPDAHIAWAVDSRYAEILRGNELIDDLIELDTRSLAGGKTIEGILLDVTSQLNRVRKAKFDVTLDFQGLWKSAFVGKFSGAKERWGFSKDALREPSSRMLLTHTANVDDGIHVIRKNLELASQALKFYIADEEPSFPIFTAQANVAEAEAIAAKAGGKFAILNPGGGWVTKLWPAENFGALAAMLRSELGIVSVITSGPGDAELAKSAAAADNTKTAIIAEPSLKALYELAKRASVYIGGDTGPTHIAAAAGTRAVGLFGPTEWWRNGTLNQKDICVERSDIGCRVNCHRRTCDKWICMDISVETVFDAVKARLASDE